MLLVPPTKIPVEVLWDPRAKELRNREAGVRSCQVGGQGRHSILCPLTWLGLTWRGVHCSSFPFMSLSPHLINEGPGWGQISRIPSSSACRCGSPEGVRVPWAWLKLCLLPPRDAPAGRCEPEFPAGAPLLAFGPHYTSRSFRYCIPLLFRGWGMGRVRASGIQIKIEGREFERWKKKEVCYRGQRWGLLDPLGHLSGVKACHSP